MLRETQNGIKQHNRITGFSIRVGAGVAHPELVEERPAKDDSPDTDTRKFLVVDGQDGHEQLAVTLAGIKGHKARIAIEVQQEASSRLGALPLDEVIRSAMLASDVSTGFLDPESTTVEPIVLSAAGFEPTEEPGQFAIAA